MGLMKILKFLGGNIIEKPIEIVGKQLEFYQQRKNAAHDQKLLQEEAQFMQKLELDRKKFNAELDAMVSDKEVERGKKILDAIKEYQITMAESSNSIYESLGKMTIELRRQAHDLMEEKKQAYLQMQKNATATAMDQLKTIRSEFPEGSMEYQFMGDAVRDQVVGIVESSNSFMKMIDADFAKMTDNLDMISRNAAENTNQYISMTLGSLIPNQLRGGGDTKLLR
ncbi:MAG: hypothetical protein IJS69_05780 [Selenomonadaceae bacterium]|nr:hypothetical protein [Selenomonadaceae bacterium]